MSHFFFMKGISLFASGGIGDLALRGAGVNVILANELLDDRCDVLKANYPETEIIEGDIWLKRNEIIEKTKILLKGENLDVLFATPPCQGMSKNGMGKLLSGIRSGLRPKLDPRNQLIIPALDIAVEFQPEIIIFENVPEMKDTLIESPDGDLVNIIDFVSKRLPDYVVCAEVVEFANYGVPQRRKRLITIATKNPHLIKHYRFHKRFLPNPTHSKDFEKNKLPWITIRNVISHLPKLDSENITTSKSNITYHCVPVLEPKKYFWIKHTPPEKGAFDNQCIKCDFKSNPTHSSQKNKEGINRASEDTPIYCANCGELLPRPTVEENGNLRLMKGFTSAYKRMNWDLPANTLTTNLSYVSSDSTIHPDQNRVLSLYEAFIIHTINEYPFKFERKSGKKITDKVIREIIGESIPPKGLEVLFSHLFQIMLNENNSTIFSSQQIELDL